MDTCTFEVPTPKGRIHVTLPDGLTADEMGRAALVIGKVLPLMVVDPPALENGEQGPDTGACCDEPENAGVHDTIETCETVRGPCLDPARHHPFRSGPDTGADT